ncbi:hypothetical protein EJF18_10512 [Clavispora lusitaniae]|uniref:Uncharacterized protein n=1 Tax=Clavispora lusitaniae TaxID=36911 RepID=A0ACD0WED6_CLALS|nr:hypothetical protein EJF14_10512 [Clavispora lusitaniae]QFZ31280.1 hypothetical protein EJF16_10512 [Clavispora lusitaniae]QFZ36948.1 hypothetical protein EJF15_10512 [Clavispora lusitaniae]QFZ42632.1 hypothetical protein EJF18_10512 [Clavispora lusitaniae]QFZ48308.1 hypothetical protein EJF17_10512 [Clavispora lusitaniae]
MKKRTSTSKLLLGFFFCFQNCLCWNPSALRFGSSPIPVPVPVPSPGLDSSKKRILSKAIMARKIARAWACSSSELQLMQANHSKILWPVNIPVAEGLLSVLYSLVCWCLSSGWVTSQSQSQSRVPALPEQTSISYWTQYASVEVLQ